VLGVLAQPVIRVAVLAPAFHREELRALAIAAVVRPLADVDVVVAVPEGAAPLAFAVAEVALVDPALVFPGETPEAVVFAVAELALVDGAAQFGFLYQRFLPILAI